MPPAAEETSKQASEQVDLDDFLVGWDSPLTASPSSIYSSSISSRSPQPSSPESSKAAVSPSTPAKTPEDLMKKFNKLQQKCHRLGGVVVANLKAAQAATEDAKREASLRVAAEEKANAERDKANAERDKRIAAEAETKRLQKRLNQFLLNGVRHIFILDSSCLNSHERLATGQHGFF